MYNYCLDCLLLFTHLSLFTHVVSSSDYTALKDRLINEWLGKDVEGSTHGLI
jgi:hypothetical protein